MSKIYKECEQGIPHVLRCPYKLLPTYAYVSRKATYPPREPHAIKRMRLLALHLIVIPAFKRAERYWV